MCVYHIMYIRTYVFLYRWVSECGDILRSFQTHWGHLVPKSSSEPAALAEKFFNCICSLMSIQLRQIVESSLNELVEFLALYKVRM